LSNGHTLHVLVCPTDKLRISVDVDGERTINLDVKSWYTVADVKLMIDTLEGLPASTQILMHTQPGGAKAALKDTETLQNQGIRNNGTVKLYQNLYVTNGMQISVKIPSVRKTIKLSVKRSHSVADVKLLIQTLEGALARTQILSAEVGGHFIVLKDTKTLQSQHVKNNDILTLHMDRTVQFFVRTLEGKTLTVMLDLSDTTKGCHEEN